MKLDNMELTEMISIALLIPIFVLLTAIIWIVTGPITFLDRIIVITLACGIILTSMWRYKQ